LASDRARFDVRVPTRRGGIDVEVEVVPAPTRERLMVSPFQVRVRGPAGELVGEAERTVDGHFRWSATVFGHCSHTGVEMIETRVNDALHAVLSCSLLIHLVRPQRAVA
jgi:hypothetical protein